MAHRRRDSVTGSSLDSWKRCRLRPVFGGTGDPPHDTLVPPAGDWMAVSSPRSHTNGQPSARCQNSPTSRGPSQATSAR
jgi:hypothetical protein